MQQGSRLAKTTIPKGGNLTSIGPVGFDSPRLVVMDMEFKLQNFDTPLTVSRIANIHYFEFTKEYHTFNDAHSFCELLYVDKGSIAVEAENYTGILQGNQMIIHRPNEKHSLKCPDDTCSNVIIIGFECDCAALIPFSTQPVKLAQMHKKMLSEIMKEGMNVYAPPYDIPNTLEMKNRDSFPYGADQMLKINLEAFFISLVREHEQNTAQAETNIISDTKLAEIYNYIHEHYMEKITLDDICFLFATNKTSLCCKFKQEYGTTVLNYINKLKIDTAKVLIREQKLSITEISEQLSFGSIHYFCKLFKKHTGLSPKEYSKTIKSRLNL